ncbi:MAG TPA: hypothetical protein IAA75_03385 [Candidatus Pullichristensenella avicola]|nr:hypothetical protein [Candidatus Pullichristensenella avicola]
MAGKKRAGRKKRRLGLKIALALAVCVALFIGYMYTCTRIVHVRYATVFLRDLPEAFDGVTVLFVSDIDARSEADARAAAALMEDLSSLSPDILLLGGDYAGPGLWDAINGRGVDDAEVAASAASARHVFLSSLADFPAPLGKFAVRAADDVLPGQLAQSMATGGVRLLDGETARVSLDGQTFALTGLSPDTDVNAAAASVSAGECVIAFTHSPERFAAALTAEAAEGGPWADLLLAGGTHGGQMRLGERTLLTLTEHERRYLSGWRKEGDVFALTSQGVGCELTPLRLNTRAEVHYITLRRAEAQPEEME